MSRVRPAGALLVIAIATLSLAACASRPKPMGPAPVASLPPPPPPPGGPMPVRPPGAVSETNRSGAPAPGSEGDFVINAGDRVYFDFDSYTLRADARPVLDAQAAWLGRYGAVRVRIEGNCDERGTREYNLALGARRANAVKAYLMTHGISSGRMATVSFGKEHPLDTGDTEEADQRNRNAHTALTDGGAP